MQEELIREYIRNGGEMWTLESINTYRDGGTKSLETNLKKPNSNHCISYYIHKNDCGIPTCKCMIYSIN